VTQVIHVLSADLMRSAELLGDNWGSAAVEAIAQGSIYALLALACTRSAREHATRSIDLTQVAAFTLGVFAAYATYYAMGLRSGPTPDMAVLPLLGFLLVGLAAAVAVSTGVQLATRRLEAPLKAAVPALVLAALWLTRGNTAEPAIRLFRPHELLPGLDDVQLAVIVLAAVAIAAKAPAGVLTGLAAFLYLLKVPGSAWYLTGVLVGVYAITAAVIGRDLPTTILAALGLAIVQVCFETTIGPRWWLPFAAGLLLAALVFRLVKTRRKARRAAAPAT
jgi:branched-chain amino acid transport system permease protein